MFLATFDRCERACISSGEALAVRIVGAGLGALLIVVAIPAIAHAVTRGERGAVSRPSIAIALTLFVGWAIWSIAVSVSVST